MLKKRVVNATRPYGQRYALPNTSLEQRNGNRKNKQNIFIGVWRSLVARLTGGQEAMGSSPVTPTTNFAECIQGMHSFFIFVRLALAQKA